MVTSTIVYLVLIAFVAISCLVFSFTILKRERFIGEVVVVVPPPGSGGMPSVFYPWGGGYGGYGWYNQGGQPWQPREPAVTTGPAKTVVTTGPAPAVTTGPAPTVVTGPAKTVVTGPAKTVVTGPGVVGVAGAAIDTNWNNWKYKVVGKHMTLNDKNVRLRGINWYGFEEKQMMPEMLYYESMDSIFKKLKAKNINAIRIPFSAEFLRYYNDKDAKVGSAGTVIHAGTTPGSVVIKEVKGNELVTVTNNPNMVKYSYIAKDTDFNGKSPKYVLDEFLKMAYQYNMLVMVDLHTIGATPRWNDHAIHANTHLEIKTPALIDEIIPTSDIKKNKMSVDNFKKEQAGKPGKTVAPYLVKLTDFVFAGKEPTLYDTYPYRDIKQVNMLKFTEKEIMDRWVEFATYLKQYPHVYAMDLKNEPHSSPTATGTDIEDDKWQGNINKVHGEGFEGSGDKVLEAEFKMGKLNWDYWLTFCNELGAKILAAHEHCLIVIEGLNDWQNKSNWGGSFKEMDIKKVTLKDEKVIYSPHSYGELAGRINVKAADWDIMFGTLSKQKHMQIGEWAQTIIYSQDIKGKDVADIAVKRENEKKWADAYAKYLADNEIDNFYFAANSTSSDTESLFVDPITEDKTLLYNDIAVKLIETACPSPTLFDFTKPDKFKSP